jgi:hypothetical protein
LELEQRIRRLRQKIIEAGKYLNPPLREAQLCAFEEAHGVRLPEAYRAFLLNVGNGGMDGPPFHGLESLRLSPWKEGDRGRRYWVDLPDLARPFPFEKEWYHEDEVLEAFSAESDQSLAEQLMHGCVMLGEDGCGSDWLLVVSGPCRGIVWYGCYIGVMPTVPQRDFLQWVEDWLDGTDPEEMFGEPNAVPDLPRE